MSNDTMRLLTELSSSIEIISPDIDTMKIKTRIEEALANYNIERLENFDGVKDAEEKMEMYISAIELEGFSELTVYDYKLELNLFFSSIQKPVAHISTPDIRKYLSTKKELKSSTIGKKLFVLRSFFNWLVKEEYILKNPTLRIKPPKIPHRTPKGLSITDLEQVREACGDNRVLAIIETLYSTGVRISELEAMNISDINHSDMSIFVIGKGDKERKVYLSEKSLYYINKYLKTRNDDCEALFVTMRKPIRRMGVATIQRELRLVEKRANIGSHFTAHSFRRTLCCNLLNQGADLADVQAILGHSDPSTTLKHYGTISENRKKEAHSKYHIQ